MRFKFVFSVLLFVSFSYLSAQSLTNSVVSSAGQTSQASGFVFDWTVGELATSTLEIPSLAMTQGFQQPNLIIDKVWDIPTDWGKISCYPNPTGGVLTIQSEFLAERALSVSIFSYDGKLLLEQQLYGKEIEEQLSFVNFPSGAYVLRCRLEGTSFEQVFTIQKL